MTVVADQDVRDLVGRTGLDRTLFVEAGAGTGKTSNLVERVVNLVLCTGVRLADIAAITFTEAAASELQDRIRVRFEKVAAETDDPGIEQRCRQAIADVDLAAISTLHGFAKRILSEHPVAAGLPPQVDILDEVNSQLAHEARWERFVDRLYQDPANEELLTRAALLDIALEPRYPGHSTMKDVAGALAQSWDRLPAVAARTHGPIPPIDLTGFRRAVGELEDVTATCVDPDDKLYVTLQGHLVSMRRIAAIDDPHRALRALRRVPRQRWGPGNGGKKTAWPGTKEHTRAVLEAVNEAVRAITHGVADDVLHRFLTAMAGEVLEAAETRRVDGRLEFHDLLVLARRLLRTSPDARRSLHQRYQRLLLDEFQDTDPIQIELAVLIAAAVDGQEPPTWDRIPVEEGRLFFVGDPKQSIYRFRRADIGLFLQARDRFAPQGGHQRLTTNFRTVPEVVEWVNLLFARLMAEEKPGSQPRYEPLRAHRRSHPTAEHRPVLLGGPVAGKVDADGLRHLEAGDVARTIDHVRRHPEQWPVGEGTDGWRAPRLSDITILVPTRTSLPHLREALTARHIPYRLDTGTLVYSTQEVRDALAVLRAIDDPGDAVSLVAALRSPLYACADPDLFTWRQAGGRWDLTARRPDSIDEDHPVAAALAHLRARWQERWWLGPSELLGRVLDDRRAFLLAYGQDRPTEVWRRLRFLLDQARAFEEAGGASLRAFLQWAELQGSEGARVHDPLLPETDDDAVRILTVHGSKGLEFPLTILSGMTTRPQGGNRGFSLLWDDDGFPQLRYRSDVATDAHNPRADIEAEMDTDEKLRLLYVACTRARDHLVVSCHHTLERRGGETYAGQVWSHSQALDGSWRRLPEDDAESFPVPEQGRLPLAPTPVDDGEAWRAEREALLAPQRRPRFVSATTIAREAGLAPPEDDVEVGSEAGADPASADPGERAVAPVGIGRRGRAGTAIGRAVHATLQVLDLADPVDLDGQAARQAELEAVPEAAETVAAMVRSALGSAAVRAAIAARHHKEVYVAAPVGDRVVEGYVDLLVEGPDGLVVIDYKTDAVRSEADVEAKLASYELQGATYAVALEASTGLPVVGCRFVFCRPSGAIERSVADLEGAKDRVRRHLAG